MLNIPISQRPTNTRHWAKRCNFCVDHSPRRGLLSRGGGGTACKLPHNQGERLMQSSLTPSSLAAASPRT